MTLGPKIQPEGAAVPARPTGPTALSAAPNRRRHRLTAKRKSTALRAAHDDSKKATGVERGRPWRAPL
eukprot:14096465-Alexandrium_andersonii.AAC.1